MSELERTFQEASDAYVRSIEGFQNTPDERAAAARELLACAARFWRGGAAALAVCREKLETPWRAVSSRLLTLSAEPEAARLLISAYRPPGRPRAPVEHLRLLGRTAPPPPELRDLLARADRHDRPPILGALLRRPTPEAHALFAATIAGGEPDDAVAAVRAAAGWKEPALLSALLDGGDDPVHSFRQEAAFQLALSGDHAAVAWLDREATASNRERAASACRHLACLAWPGGVERLAALLSGTDLVAVAWALPSVRLLGAMALAPLLLELAKREPEPVDARPIGGGPLPDLAVTALEDLTGVQLPDEIVGLAMPGEDTKVMRLAAVPFFEETLAGFDLHRRYLRGRRVTLELLAVEQLTVRDELGVVASYQLRAMTGEHHGVDPDDDIVANLPAIEAWISRAKVPLPIEPGGWIYAGQPLSAPEPVW